MYDSQLPEEYRPISMWGYLGYQLLFAIPLVGLIVLIVFSFGGTRNINLRNYARSFLCLMLILIVLAVLVAMTTPALIGYLQYAM